MDVTVFKNVIGEDCPSTSVYAAELLKHMPKEVKGFTIEAKRLPFIRHYFHKEFIYPPAAGKHQGDVNHICDQSYAGLLKYLDPKRTVVTCHDLIPLDRPEENSILGKKRYWMNVRYLPKAAKIIAISKETKECILRHFDCKEEDVPVVYYGVPERFKILDDMATLKKRYNIKTKTILHVGTSFPRKNVWLVLKALSKLEDVLFLKVGRFTKRQRDFIRKTRLESRVREFYSIDQSALAELYNIADILVAPSYAEGFCMPIAEGMTCGCPVICSDIKVFRELYDGAAIFIDPDSIDDMVDKINMLYRDSKLREGLVEKGITKVKAFNWQRCAEETYKIYEGVFNKK